MVASPAVRAQDIQMPAGVVVPGLQRLGAQWRPILVHSFGLVDAVNSVANQNPLVMPFRAKIVLARFKIRAQLGTGPAIISIGRPDDGDAYAAKTVPIADAAGVEYVYDEDADFTQPIIEAGAIVTANGDGGATSTGSVDVSMVYTPWP